MARPATADDLIAWCHGHHARVTFETDGTVSVLAKRRTARGASLGAAVEAHQLATLVSDARKAKRQ